MSSLSEDIEDLRKKHRILGISAFDRRGTLGIAYSFSRYFNVSFTRTTIAFLVGGELVHLAMGIDTVVTKKINEAKN